MMAEVKMKVLGVELKESVKNGSNILEGGIFEKMAIVRIIERSTEKENPKKEVGPEKVISVTMVEVSRDDEDGANVFVNQLTENKKLSGAFVAHLDKYNQIRVLETDLSQSDPEIHRGALEKDIKSLRETEAFKNTTPTTFADFKRTRRF